MYLYKKDLFPLAYVVVENGKEDVQWTVNDSREAVDYEVPPLRKVRLQVETAKSRRIQALDDELTSITLYHDDGKIVIDSGDESYKLLKLVDAFQELDPDIVVTDGGGSFIFPYLTPQILTYSVRSDELNPFLGGAGLWSGTG
jgi:DNA polymerase elongation subunit (family B)